MEKKRVPTEEKISPIDSDKLGNFLSHYPNSHYSPWIIYVNQLHSNLRADPTVYGST